MPTSAEFIAAARERLKGKSKSELAHLKNNESVSGWDRQAAVAILGEMAHHELIAPDKVARRIGLFALIVGLLSLGVAIFALPQIQQLLSSSGTPQSQSASISALPAESKPTSPDLSSSAGSEPITKLPSQKPLPPHLPEPTRSTPPNPKE